MRKLNVKIIIGILSMVLVFVVFPSRLSYAAAAGTYGVNISWSLDDNNVLTITGNGELKKENFTVTSGYQASLSYVEKIVVKGNITSIGDKVFSDFTKVKEITIPNSVKSIGSYAFYYCQYLEEITLPSSLTTIGDYAFYCCFNLRSIEIPSKVTSIGKSPFLQCNTLSKVVINNGVTSIGPGLFKNVSNLNEIVIPDSVTTIYDEAFYGTGIKSLVVPNSVTYIGKNAFEKCSKLESLVLDKNACVEDTLSGVSTDVIHFYYDITYTNNGHGTVSGKTRSYGTDAVELSIKADSNYILREVTLTDKNKTEKITRDNNGKYIMPDADATATVCASFVPINKCGENLTWTINDSGTLTIIGSGSMYDWETETDVPWYSNRSKIKSVVLSENVTSIGAFAFSSCANLTGFSVPDSVIVIGDSAFKDCTGLLSIDVPDTVTSIGVSAFNNCRKLKDFTIPKNIKTIGDSTFKDCRSFKNVVIPEGVTSIGANAFYFCNGLESIQLPESLDSIGYTAFKYCGFESVIIPYNVSTIATDAFAWCADKSVVVNKDVYSKNGFPYVSTDKVHFYYDVKYTSDGHGTITGKTRSYGTDNVEFHITPDAGYEIDTVTLKYGSQTRTVTATNGKYTCKMPNSDSDVTVHVTFKKIMYTIEAPDVENGYFSISQRTAGIGDTIYIYLYPNEGYTLDAITINGSPIPNAVYYYGSPITFVMGTGDTSVIVSFKKIEYSVVVQANNGSAKVSKELANVGDKITISTIPDKCYELDYIMLDNEILSTNEFTMPERSVTVRVVFKPIPHELTLVPAKKATCTEDGYEVYYICDNCQKLFSDDKGNNEITKPIVISKFGHSWDDGEVTKEPTCEEEGVKTFRCTHEGCTATKTESIKAIGHSWDEGTVTKEPTCEEAGVKTFHCTRTGCSETKTEPINALGHNKIVEVAEKAPTKTEPGNIKHYKCERCGKLFSDAKGKNPITKEQTIIPAMGHDLTAVKAKAATCTEPGNTAYYICKDDDCKCGKAYSDPYGQHEINIADTVIPSLGHNPKEVAGKDPTCTEDGYEKYYKCSRCNKLFSDADGKNEIEKPVVVPKLGHDMEHVDAKKPTHEDDGHKEYYHCNRCGKNFADEDGKSVLTDAEIVIPHIGAAVLGEEITEGDFIYKVTNPRTDGTGTVTIVGVANAIESVIIPATVELKLDTYKVNRIGSKAFYGDKTVKTVYIGNNVVIIDTSAFYGCSNLVKVSGGKALKTIGANAFARCPKLNTFVITSSVLSKIGTYAFNKDSKLKTIYIKNTVKLTKSGVKKSLKGSKVKTVKVKKSKVKKYKKYFTKKNAGRKVKVKK